MTLGAPASKDDRGFVIFANAIALAVIRHHTTLSLAKVIRACERGGMKTVVGINATVTLDESAVTIAQVHSDDAKRIAWTNIGGVTIAPAAFGARPKLLVVEKGASTPSFIIVPLGKDEEFAALKAEMVRRVVGAGAPLFQPGDSVVVSSAGRRDSASLRAVHGSHLLVTLEDGTDRWVERSDVEHA